MRRRDAARGRAGQGSRWSRVFGDTLFAIGAIGFVVVVVTLTMGRSRGEVIDEQRTSSRLPTARASRR